MNSASTTRGLVSGKRTAEEQITGEAEHGGIQVIAYPMRRAAYQERLKKWEAERSSRGSMLGVCFSRVEDSTAMSYDMALAPGGRMRQEIYDDPYQFNEWDTENASRCFVHIANSMVWRSITGKNPPTTPPTSKEYTKARLPWFEYYSDGAAIEGSGILAGLKSVTQIGQKKGDVPLPENESVTPDNVVHLRAGLQPGQVREGQF